VDEKMEFNSTVELLLAETEPKKVQAPPPAAAAEVQVVPLLVKIFPDVPGATDATAEVPLPTNTALAVSVVAPVPPLVTGKVPLAELTLTGGITEESVAMVGPYITQLAQ
jgi:hypothetical protein